MSDFVQLKFLAKNTVGVSGDYLLDQMNILLEIYSQLDAGLHGVNDPQELSGDMGQSNTVRLAFGPFLG